MLCVSSVDSLITYYETFKRKREAGLHDLRIVTIFTFNANEDDADANGEIGEPDFNLGQVEPARSVQEAGASYQVNAHSRDKLAAYVSDYNALYQTKQSVKDGQGFYAYYKDIAKRIKERDKKGFDERHRVDILLVVNMFLTGFDAKKLNTLYVDKNLKYHGLIQAFSRTNRTLGELKSQGNIVCFRHLKAATDEAITLFSDENAQESILLEPYEHYVDDFNQGADVLQDIAATPDAVNELISEDDQLAFVKAFRRLMRNLNVLKSFTEFDFEDLGLDQQRFENYKSKYLDIYERTRHKREGEGASIIEEVDFELELIERDEINVAYILQLLAAVYQKAHSDDPKERRDGEEQKQAIHALLNKEPRLRSKRELIEQFIQDYMPHIPAEQDFDDVFREFWDAEKQKAVSALCDKEGMNPQAVYAMLDAYRFSGKQPLRETVFAAMQTKPKVLERKKLFARVVDSLMEIVTRFEEGI